ncbi:MAG: hypothetical protein RXQ93_02485 [Caldisphaera sp.]|uniref:hypothetical protein n=1 Tax=Caldisphaera sp. TaxID=2060322 RepID=UPI00397D96B6
MKEKIIEAGICPYCNAPTDYKYEIDGPIMKDNEPYVEISYQVNCTLCGFNESRTIYIPLSGLYVLRYMLTPRSRIALEKIKILTDIRKIENSVITNK